MKFCRILLSFVVLSLFVSSVHAQEDKPTREKYVSDASFIVATYQPRSREHTPEAMASAANHFVKTLTDEQRRKVVLPIDHPERRKWTNLPARPTDGGIRMELLTAEQVKAACDLMGTLFSEQGYSKMCNIMLADDQLLPQGRKRVGFGTEYFSIVIFGEPSPTKPWAFQLDGHHIGVNVAVEGGKMTMSPSFIGTQPSVFKIAEKETKPLAGETDLAYRLLESLDDDQTRAAVLGPRRGNLRAGPGRDNQVPPVRGVSCKSFNEEQRKMILSLIRNWVGDLPADHAEKRMKTIESQLDQTHFAWDGMTKSGSDISYSIQGPSLIIEYACQSLGGNPLDHLHTIYRDPTNEYGLQIGKQE